MMRFFRRSSARLRLTVLLTLALVPLGLIALLQAREVSIQARTMSERALLGETLRAAAAQREVIRTAQGQARALVPLVRGAAGDAESCSTLMGKVVEGAQLVDYAGFLGVDGRLDCTSDGARHDLSDSDARQALSAVDGGARVATGSFAPTGGLMPPPHALVVLQPVHGIGAASDAGGARPLLGTILLALPREALLSADLIPGAGNAPVELTTINGAGEILWASPTPPGMVVGSADAARADRLPEAIDLAALVSQPAHAMTARSGAGDRRAYAAVPVISGELMTLGSWQPGSLFADAGARPLALGVLMPLMMWGLSLAVAYVAVSRMILSPLGHIRERMQAFTAGARTLPPLRLTSAPEELRVLADSFDAMTTRIVTDEQRLEKAVHDQKVLLKEVHHRVKNNLQLIASILNMQIRQDRSDESRAVLRRVQDRVMSLATVHQHLYQAPSLSALRSDSLLREIVNRKMADTGGLLADTRVEVHFDPVRLYPDQAVPLALLVGEAVTNAQSHIGRPPDGTAPWVRIAMVEEPGGAVSLTVENSGGASLDDGQATHRAGLGMRLMEAFARQLDGTFSAEAGSDRGDAWRLSLRFVPTGFAASPAALSSD